MEAAAGTSGDSGRLLGAAGDGGLFLGFGVLWGGSDRDGETLNYLKFVIVNAKTGDI